jgi:hypothetical protein
MKTKNERKGAYKGQNEGNRPSKIQKVPRVYESLNPALGEWCQVSSTQIEPMIKCD